MMCFYAYFRLFGQAVLGVDFQPVCVSGGCGSNFVFAKIYLEFDSRASVCEERVKVDVGSSA